MKSLHIFYVNKEQEVDEVETSKNEEGNEVKITKKVKKNVSNKFFIIKPTRTLRDDAELFYNVVLSESIKKGLITQTQLSKRLDNDDGILSKREEEQYRALFTDLLSAEQEFQRLTAIPDADKTDADKAALEEIKKKTTDTQILIKEFEARKSTLFNCTAETRARNKTVLWLVLFMAYSEDEQGKQTPFFSGTTFEDKLKDFDNKEEQDDPFLNEVMKKFAYYVSFWYLGGATKSEDFAKLPQNID